MTTTVCRWIRMLMITGAMTLFATVASPQSAHDGGATAPHEAQGGQTSSGSQSMAAMLKLGMTRMAAADADLKALVADMNMFTGEMKIETMARLLTLLVERQSMMREHMTAMYERMMRTMMDPISGATDEGPPDTMIVDELEPGAMCAPE